MTALGWTLALVIAWATWAPREVGEFIAEVVNSYEMNLAALRAKREAKP